MSSPAKVRKKTSLTLEILKEDEDGVSPNFVHLRCEVARLFLQEKFGPNPNMIEFSTKRSEDKDISCKPFIEFPISTLPPTLHIHQGYSDFSVYDCKGIAFYVEKNWESCPPNFLPSPSDVSKRVQVLQKFIEVNNLLDFIDGFIRYLAKKEFKKNKTKIPNKEGITLPISSPFPVQRKVVTPAIPPNPNMPDVSSKYDAYKTRFSEWLKILDRQFDQRVPYLCGNECTLADLFLFPYYNFYKKNSTILVNEIPETLNLEKWYTTMLSRENLQSIYHHNNLDDIQVTVE